MFKKPVCLASSMLLAVSLVGSANSVTLSPSFTDAGAGLPTVIFGSAAWGDYDNDGDLDLVLTGLDGSTPTSRIYRNDGGTFVDIGAGLIGVRSGSVAWGDYDNDGDLDLAISGLSTSGLITRIDRNDGGTFVDIGAGLPGVSSAGPPAYHSIAWGDFDNDGDLDLLITGQAVSGPISRIYRNDGGVFTDIAAGLPGVGFSSVAWGDYDGDGHLDFALSGKDNAGVAITRVFHSSGGPSPTFTGSGVGLTGTYVGSVAWGDYDNDGDLDLLTNGTDGSNSICRIDRNDSGTFTDLGAGLAGAVPGQAEWADYDNDGDLDVLVAGSGGATRIYRNDGGAFVDAGAGLPALTGPGAGSWADYDHDGRLDVLLLGAPGTVLYRSSGGTANTAPNAPTQLSVNRTGNILTLHWSAATDAQTPSAGLSYNIRIGTTAGGSEATSAMADNASGFRRVVGLGNAQQRTSWSLTLPPATYFWSVQAVDGAFAGSPFTAEQAINANTAVDRGGPFAQITLRTSVPNPFTRTTALSYDLPREEPVRLQVFDLDGRLVRTLVSQSMAAGSHESIWDGASDRGLRQAPGLYLFRIRAGVFEATQRVVFIP